MPKPTTLGETSTPPATGGPPKSLESESKGKAKPWRGIWVRVFPEKVWSHFLREGIESGGLKPNHLKVFLLLLTLVNEDGEIPVSQAQMARWVGMKASTMSSVLKGLEEWGIIVRLGGRGQDHGLMFNPRFATRAYETDLDKLIELFDRRWTQKLEKTKQDDLTSITVRHYEAPHPMSKNKGPKSLRGKWKLKKEPEQEPEKGHSRRRK